MRRNRTIAALVAVALLSVSAVAAPKSKAKADDQVPPAFRLAKIFADNMVLQRDKPIHIWGWAPAGTKVTVTLTQDAKAGKNAEAAAGLEPPSQPRLSPDNERGVTMQYVEANPPAPVNETVEVTAGPDGKWLAELKPAKGSFRPTWIVAKSGKQTLAVRNVLIGEIWVCAGQSNMEWSNYDRKDREGPSDDFPGLRYVSWNDSWYKPLDDVRANVNWQPCTPETVDHFSSVPYLYGLFIHRYLKVPVGIINVARGGTLGQTWCMRDELDNIDNKIIKLVLKEYDDACATWDDPAQVKRIMADWQKARDAAREKFKRDTQDYKTKLAEYKKALAEATDPKAKNRIRPPREPRLRLPKQPGDARSGWSPPAGLFNATIMPIRQLGIRGVLYYQGENQAFDMWTRYESTFPKIPVSFRKAFGEKDLWFGCISQPGWGKFGIDPEIAAVRGAYAFVRDIQQRALRGDAHAGMISTYPTGNSYIHPSEKFPVAEYASLWALAKVYDQPVVHRANEYQKMEIKDGKIYLYFDADPIVYNRWKRLAPNNANWQVLPQPYQGNAPIEGFVIADKDRRWYPATARDVKLGKDGPWTIELSSDLCKNPVAARYGWANWPTGNLVGRSRLPVPVFRTDDWPLPVGVRYSPEARAKAQEKIDADLKIAQKQALDRKIRQAVVDLPKLENELYASKLQRDLRKFAESKIARIQAVLDQLKEERGPLSRQVSDKDSALGKKIDAVEKALQALRAEAAKINN